LDFTFFDDLDFDPKFNVYCESFVMIGRKKETHTPSKNNSHTRECFIDDHTSMLQFDSFQQVPQPLNQLSSDLAHLTVSQILM